VAWCYGLLALPGIVGLALLPGPQPGGFFELGPIPNPLGWEAAGEVLRPVNAMAQVVATALLGAAAVSIVLRLRRAGGVQRQQLKWLAYAAVLLAGYYLLAFLYTRGTIRSVPPLIDTAVSGLGLVVVPAAIGMAVLRYRLYDIDRLINRTLVHGLLTLLLGAGYAAVALVLGQLAGRDSSLAVAGATLAVAALFQPARLRDEVDLDTLTGELLAVAAQTMQPTKASLAPGRGSRLTGRRRSGRAGVPVVASRTQQYPGQAVPERRQRVPIDPADLAKSIGALGSLDAGTAWPRPCSRSPTRPSSCSGPTPLG